MLCVGSVSVFLRHLWHRSAYFLPNRQNGRLNLENFISDAKFEPGTSPSEVQCSTISIIFIEYFHDIEVNSFAKGFKFFSSKNPIDIIFLMAFPLTMQDVNTVLI